MKQALQSMTKTFGFRRSLTLAGAVALIAALSASGCGGGGKTKTATPAPGPTAGAINVSESEYKLDPANVKVPKTGPVTIKVTNNGKIEHSLEVEGNGLEKKLPSNISPGQSTTLKVNLKAGKYEWYCPVDGHKGLGMKGEITVANGGSASSSGGSSSSQSQTQPSGGGGGGY